MQKLALTPDGLRLFFRNRDINRPIQVTPEIRCRVLSWCAYIGRLDLVREIVQTLGADVRLDDDEAFRLAAESGHLDVVDYLVSCGADIHAKSEYALIHASGNGYFDVVVYLINRGADVFALGSYAVQNAIRNDRVRIVRYLIENTAVQIADRELRAREIADDYQSSQVLEYFDELGI